MNNCQLFLFISQWFELRSKLIHINEWFMSAFYICIGMLLISLSCWCEGKYSRKYSLGFSEESYQGEYNFLSCCGSLSIMNTMKTIQDTKRPFQQSIAELFSVDNLPNVVHHFFQSVLLASKGEWCYKANKLNYNYCNLPEEGYETASRTVVCYTAVFSVVT